MSSEFWSTLNKKKKEELLKSTQTKATSSVSKSSEELKTDDFWSVLNEDKKKELLSSVSSSSSSKRTFMQDDDDIAPVLGNTGANKSTDTVETTQAIYDKYGQYYNSPDYDEYSQKGAAIKNPTAREAEGWLTIGPWTFGDKEVGNVVTYSRDNYAEMKFGELNGGGSNVGKAIYYHMTDFEVGIYNYLLAKNGKKEAQKFLDDIEETLVAREGGMVAENIKSIDNDVGRAAMYTLHSVGAGIESAGTGLRQLFSEEALPTTATEVANALLLEDLDGFKRELYQTGNTVGNMLPSVAVGLVSPTAGRILQSSSAAGNAYRQSLKEGKTKEEAATFGVMVGGLEFVTSKLLSGVAGTTGDLPKKAMSKIATFQNPLLKVAAKYGVNLASEVTEEELQLWLEPFARQIAFGEDYDAPTLEEMAETAIVTALSTGILNSTTDIATGNLTKVNGLTQHEAKVVEKVYEQRLAEESENKTLSNKDKNKLYDKVVEEMKRGYVSTDEIESILGGKTYEGYKSLTEKKTSLEERKTAIESEIKAINDEIKDIIQTPELQFTVEQRETVTSLREKTTALREEAKGIKEELQNLGIKTAKNNLFNEVNKLTSKDTFLRESYNDLARKKQDIQIDDTKYKGTKFEDAAKKTIENARKAGANNSNRVRDFVEFSAKYSSVSGKVIDFKKDADIKGILENQLKAQINTLSKSTTAEDKAKLAELQDTLKKVQEGEIRVNGVKTKDGVAININSSNYLNTVLGHEITHFLEGNNAYEALQKAIFKYAQTKGDYEGRRKVLDVLYKNIDGTTVDYELTADLVGDYLFTEYDFIKNLSTENRNVFQQIYDQIKFMFKLATAGSKEARELEKVMHQFEKVLRESVETSQNVEHNEATTQFSLRTKPAPKKTQEVYKLMRLKDGEIYPLFIDSTEPLKVGEWYDADSPNLDFLKEMPSGVFLVDANNGTYQSFDEYLQESGERKTKYPSKKAIEKATAEGKRWVFIEDTAKAQKRFDGETRKYWNIGINGSGSVSTFSMRPGYHAGSLPTMRQIGKGANRDLRDDSFVWTVGEVPADIDYQAEAEMNPDKDIPTHIPEDGYYLKATNADKAKSQADRVGWYVAGSYKINRIISDSEARQVIDNWNNEHPDTPVEYDYDRESGMDFDADQMKLVPKSDTKNSISEDSEAEKGGVSYDETSESYSPVKYSLSTWNKSDYVFERKKAASDMAKTLGIAEEKALQYIDSVNSIAKMVADDQERLGYEASPGRSAFVSNAEYGGSIDFSTICKKRRLFTGTFEAIQNALPNTALTAEEVLEIRKMMKDKGYEVSCGLCYVEGSRANMGQFTKQFIERYKATNPEYVPNMAEMNTATGQEQIRKEHPEVYEAYEYFMNHYGKLSPDDKALFASQQKPKMYQMATEYKGEILDIFGNKESSVAEKNKNGGLRLQSFSDFEIIHLLDSMQVIMDMSRVGLAGQAYTKVPDFAWALGDTGLKINLSLIAKGVDENGRLILDDVEGMKESDAMALRDRYSDNVGTILVAFNDEQLKAAMADERIDYIIPYHRSQWKTSQYESMGLPENTKDYTAWQNESYIEPVYNKNGKKQRPSNYMPNTYWDFNKSGKENAEKYLQMCADNNRRPKFSHLLVDNGDGSYSLQPDGSTDGYWKTLIDFKMYNNDGIGVPQNPVTPDFNMEEAQRMLNEYTGGHSKFPVANDIVEEFVSKHPDNIAPTNIRYSLSNSLTDIDKDDNIGYNEFDFYTDSEDFFVDVAKGDRDSFPRSLANKTTGMAKDEIRIVEIIGAGKVYFFEATGYMKGQMLYSADVGDIDEYRTVKKEFIDGNNSSRNTFGSWSSVLPFDGTGTRSDIHSIENGRTESDVYEVYGESRTRNGTGTQERIGENFEDDPEEVKRIIAELRKMYGFAENDLTNDIAPINEVSSSDDAFFDGENPQNSLSYEGDNRTLGGNYRFDGKDFLKSDIAPVAEPTQTVEDTTFDAPMLEDIPILPDEELEQGTIATIRPKPEKQPSMKRVNNAESKEHVAQVLTEEPKTEKKKKGVLSTLVRNFVDKGAVFENLSLKTKNRALQDTYKAMGRSETKAQYFMENGTEGVKPLDSIREEVEQTGKTKEFYEYLYHKHNVDRMSLESRERPNLKRLTSKMNELKLLNLQENQLKAIASEKITKDTTQKRADLIKTVREYLKSKDVKNKPVFDYSVTAEMSQEAVKQYEAQNPDFKEYAQDVYNYMNHLRQMMVYNGVISPETAELWAKTYPYYVPIRRVDSNGLSVDVPLDTGRTGINAPIKRATGGNSDILPLFETMAQRTLQTFKAIDKNRFGIELKDTLGGVTESTTTSLDEVIDSIDAHESLLQEGKNGRNPTFTVFEGGERVTFDITDEMYDALKPTSEGLSYTNKVLNKASNIHRGLLTEYSVPFMVTNAIKDAQDVLINSQHPAQTYANSPVAIKELLTKGTWYTEYMENGGGDNTYFDKQTNTFNKEKSALRKVIGFPLDKISDVNNFIEKVPRLAEYIASRKSGASIDAAMLDAARVTTDFSAGGDVTKFLNRNGATFLNASVQGFAQQVRNVREAKANGLKGWLGLATKYAIAGLPALLLNHLLWDDDEEYEELSDYVKENYYVVAKYGDGKFVRIPKGRTLAVIQNAFEQISNTLTGDDEADFGRFFELFLSNLAPNNPLDNNIIAPIKQVMENKTWYGEDLVPTRLQDLPAAEQYDESTDAISKWLGEKINVSPYKINYLLNQYSGGVGDILLPMMTPEAESGDNSLLGNFVAPLKDKFTTDSVMNNQNISDFYSKADELKVKANSSYATEEDILKSKYMNAINSELSELYKAKREIQNSSLSDAVKYAKVREIQKQINALAKESLNTYDNVVSDDNYANVGDKHYKLNDDGEWQKINDKQVEKQAPFVKVYGGYSSYITYSSDLYDIKADKDEYGKSINGSRKEKVLNYINNLDADYETKIILFKSEYPSDDTYNMEIINYINNRTDLTYEERVAIFTELGFTVANGSVYWD